MKASVIRSIFFFCLLLTAFAAKAQTTKNPDELLGVNQPWKSNELMTPLYLAEHIKNDSTNTIIFNIGAVEDIEGATHIGPTGHTENLEKFKNAVRNLSKSKQVIIYCGCCPFARCPNVVPAYTELKKMGFKNIKILNLTTNLKTDWIEKGYPLSK